MLAETLSNIDTSPIWLSLKLASIVTLLLIVVITPIAWQVSKLPNKYRAAINALTALPLVLPPSVLGFYMLILLGSNGPFSSLGEWAHLAFSFKGLVIASLIYSLPFAMQPLQNAFENIEPRFLEAAATLGASPLSTFIYVVLPLVKPAYLTACILTFAHTIGEFGVILMMGGNIPGETRVLSIAIYDHVESLEYYQANILAGGMLAFSFIVLLGLYLVNGKGSSNWLSTANVSNKKER